MKKRESDMKTIVNTLRLSLLLGFMAIGMTVWSQIPHVEKMSISTQMFLDEWPEDIILTVK